MVYWNIWIENTQYAYVLGEPWIIEHRGVDRKRARPTILNVWRFGKPLKYSGLRAASEVPRSASRNSTALCYLLVSRAIRGFNVWRRACI